MRLVISFLCIVTQSLFAGYADFEAQFKVNPIKHRAWQEKAKIIDQTVDGLGFPIDEKIKEPVIALNLLGFKTVASCEGHLDRGIFYPWMDIEVATEQELRAFHQESTALWQERDALSPDENQKQIELGERVQNLCELWEESFCKRSFSMHQLLEEFYKSPASFYDVMIVADTSLSKSAVLRLYSLDGKWQSAHQEEEKKAKFLKYQQEMDRFTNFLIKKFLEKTEPTGYILGSS